MQSFGNRSFSVSKRFFPCILFHAIGNAIVSYGIMIDNGVSSFISYGAQVIFAIVFVLLYEKIRKESDQENK